MKRLLVGLGVLAGIGVLALIGGGLWLYAHAAASNVGELRFANELKIPPLLDARRDDAGRQVFDLTLQAGTSELLPGKTTATWGANGPYLGPTLRASRGAEVVVNVDNRLPEATTLHWHGMHLPAAADGGPHQPIAAGGRWSPTWTIAQPAATLWYHPHVHGDTEGHVYRGIAGLFILDDPTAAALPLPKEYGVDDIPLIVQDKRFEEDGALDFSQSIISPIGFLGPDILINGTYDPHVAIAHRRVRFRLLNASTARVYNFGFSDDRVFDLIATDGGLLEAPHRTARVQLSPGERAEIVVAFEPGERSILRGFAPELGTNFFDGRFSGGDDTFDLLQIRAAADLAPAPATPDRLVTGAPLQLDERDAVQTRRFELQGTNRINGTSLEMGRIDAVVLLDTTEIWEVRNGAGIPHSFHVHDFQFRIIEYDGAAAPPGLAGPKDTVYVPPGATVRLLVRFRDYADPATPYMFHCHILEHEDRGMMGQFTVVKPEQRLQTPHQGHGD